MRTRSDVRTAILTAVTLAVAALAVGCRADGHDPAEQPVGIHIDARVLEACPSIGGCAYEVEIVTADATYRAALVQRARGLIAKVGLPAALRPGTVTVTLTSRTLSDTLVDGRRDRLAVDAQCSADVRAEPGLYSVGVHASFVAGSCSIELSFGIS